MASRSSDHSETGFQLGLREVLLEVVAPAFLMVMLGSLVFFLLEIKYRGHYELPIHWVYGLYVFAIVLVCRIGIIEGLERARFFAGLLIAAVAFHTGIGTHLIVVFLTWWAASKLTWDCTFIDESRDVTGQGLVSAALDRWRTVQSKFLQVWRGEKSLAQVSEPQQPTHASQSEESSSPVAQWMRELLWKRKRKNTPGIWAFFFFIAGLVVFAVGQLFVEPSERARNYSLWMFTAYAFSGLGLMMFISLIGLFRYLKQRGTSMPDSIARSWLVMGTLFALAFAGVLLFLPWPSTNVSLSSWLPTFHTAKRTGDNSLLTERGKVDAPNGSGKPDDRGASGKGSEPSEQQGVGGVAGGDRVGNQSQGKPGSSSGGNVGGGKGPKPASSQAQASQANSPPQKSNSGKPTPAKQGEKQPGDSNPQNKANQPGPKQAPSNATQQSPSRDGPKKESDSAPQSAQSNSRPPTPRTQNQSQAKASQTTPSSQDKNNRSFAERSPRDNAPQQSNELKQPPKQKAAGTDESPAQWWQSIVSFLKSISSFLIWLAAIIAACVLAIRYRNQIVDGLTAFLKSLSDLLARLSGGGKRTEGERSPPSTASAAAAPQRSFSTFRNPFNDAQWARRPSIEILEHTFAALEALAREVKLPREIDETPLEFARRFSEQHRSVAGARLLAELYSQAAYASAAFSPSDLKPLAEVWSQMQTLALRMTAPQPVAVG